MGKMRKIWVALFLLAGIIIIPACPVHAVEVTTIPKGKLMFSEDFQGDLSQWEQTDWAKIVEGRLQKAGETNQMRIISKPGKDWRDYILEFDFEILNRWAGWIVRYIDGTGYYMFMTDGRVLEQYVCKDQPAFVGRTNLEPIIKHNQKVHVTVEVRGNLIRHYFDGRLVDTWIDSTLSAGAVGFRENGAEQTAFDNVRVYALAEPLAKDKSQLTLPLATIPFANHAPVLDGVIGDREWQEAALFTGFSDLTGKYAQRQTQVWACWDQTNLYLAIRSKKKYQSGLLVGPHDDKNIFQRDAIEINLSTSGAPEARWCKLVFDAAGTRWDAIYEQDNLANQSWNPEWIVKNNLIHDIFFVTDTWETEVAIPFTSLNNPTPKEGAKWSVQVCRDFDDLQNLGYPGNQRWTSWSPAQEGGFNLPVTFGTFVFSGPESFVRITKVGGIEDGTPQMVATVQKGATPSQVTGTVRATLNNLKGPILVEKKTGVSLSAGQPGEIVMETPLDLPAVSNVTLLWELSDSAGTILSRTILSGESRPSFAVKYVSLPVMEKVLVDGDISRISNIPTKAVIVTELRSKEGKAMAQESLDLQKGQKTFLASLSLVGIESGNYTVGTSLKSKSGERVTGSEQPLTIEPKPDWAKVHTGQITQVPAPWTPVKISQQEQEIILSTWTKEYRFGKNPLPEKILIRGKNFLARPAKLVMKIAGQEISVNYGLPGLSNQSEIGATLSWSGSGEKVDIHNRARVEFDGLIWNELSIIPTKGPISVDELYIEIPISPAGLRYVRGANNMDFMHTPSYLALLGKARLPNPGGKPARIEAEQTEFSTDGWMWPEAFVNFLWIGGVDRGLFTIFNSPRNMAVAKHYNEIVEKPDVTLLRFYLVEGGRTFASEVKYEFGLLATPTRPIRDRNLMNRANGNAVSTFEPAYFQKYFDREVYRNGSLQLLPEGEIASPEESVGQNKFFLGPKIEIKKGDLYTRGISGGLLVDFGNPFPSPEVLKDIDNQALATRALGMKPVLWLDNGYTPITLPHEQPYQYEWEQYPPTRNAYQGEECTLVCPKTTWRDFYLYGLDHLMKERDIEGVYLDMSGPGGCANYYHGCGYEKDDKVEREVPFLEFRDLYLRLYNVVHTNKPEGVIQSHSMLHTPVALYVDVTTKGEGWSQEPDYRKLTLPYFQVDYMTQHQYGVAHNFFSVQNYLFYRNSLETIASLWEVVGLCLIHDTLPWAAVSESLPGLVTVYNALRDFKAYDADTTWIPYWESGIGDWQSGVAVSYYRRPEGIFLVLFNAQFDGAREVMLDLAKIRGSGSVQIKDIITGTEKSAQGTISRKIGPRKVELLLLK